LATRLDRKGQLTTFEYDVRRPTAVVLPGGARETIEYDTLGRRTRMANAESAVAWTYDALGRVETVTDEILDETIRYEYDAVGNRTAMIGPNGRVEYLFDAMNRLVEQRDPVAGTYRFVFDAAGRRTQLSYPNGLTTSHEYHQNGTLANLTTRNLAGDLLDGYAYTYDKAGRRTTMRRLQDQQ
ncbi:MAG: RHS repeat protein, partial [Deltaproteobacteria bacterium]|nr:RHS repeat protein [Deltaproteobacteria bacterium]